jgi:hypothetical protein
MAQVLPLRLIGLAVTYALPVQNVQAALCLLCTGVDHDQGLPLSDRFGIRAHLAIGDPEVKKPALEVLRARQRTPGLEAERRRRWDDCMGGGQRHLRPGKPLLHEGMHDCFRLGQ